jgi:hypothetical protein
MNQRLKNKQIVEDRFQFKTKSGKEGKLFKNNEKAQQPCICLVFTNSKKGWWQFNIKCCIFQALGKVKISDS